MGKGLVIQRYSNGIPTGFPRDSIGKIYSNLASRFHFLNEVNYFVAQFRAIGYRNAFPEFLIIENLW